MWDTTTKNNIVRHKTRCSAGTLYCTQCLNLQQPSRLTWIITLPRSTVQQDPKTITRVKNAALSFQVFIPSHTTNDVITQQKLPQVERRRTCKVLPTQEITKDWKKSYLRVDISWWVLKYEKRDIACSILLSTTLQPRLSKKNWIAFWII